MLSSLLRPSSVRTRIHVASLVRATRRYGEFTPASASRFGANAGCPVAGAGPSEGGTICTEPTGAAGAGLTTVTTGAGVGGGATGVGGVGVGGGGAPRGGG